MQTGQTLRKRWQLCDRANWELYDEFRREWARLALPPPPPPPPLPPPPPPLPPLPGRASFINYRPSYIRRATQRDSQICLSITWGRMHFDLQAGRALSLALMRRYDECSSCPPGFPFCFRGIGDTLRHPGRLFEALLCVADVDGLHPLQCVLGECTKCGFDVRLSGPFDPKRLPNPDGLAWCPLLMTRDLDASRQVYVKTQLPARGSAKAGERLVSQRVVDSRLDLMLSCRAQSRRFIVWRELGDWQAHAHRFDLRGVRPGTLFLVMDYASTQSYLNRMRAMHGESMAGGLGVNNLVVHTVYVGASGAIEHWVYFFMGDSRGFKANHKAVEFAMLHVKSAHEARTGVQLTEFRVWSDGQRAQFKSAEVFLLWWHVQRAFGAGCIILVNWTQAECGKGLADGSGRIAKAMSQAEFDRLLDDLLGACAAPASVAELVSRLQARGRFSHSDRRDAARPLKGMNFILVPESVVAAPFRGAQTVDGSNSFFSARFDASSVTPVMFAAERSCRCFNCASLLFDSAPLSPTEQGPSLCAFARTRPTAWTQHTIKVKPPIASAAAAAAAAEEDVETEQQAAAGSVVAIAAPNDPDTPFYLIQVVEQVTLTSMVTNGALLDDDEKPLKFYKGEAVLRGYWWNRTGTARSAHLPADERFEFVELWDATWRDTGTWEDGSIVRAWLKRTKDRSVEVVVRVSAVELWDVEVEDAPADAVAQHRRLGHVGRIGVLSAHTLDRLASAFSEDDE